MREKIMAILADLHPEFDYSESGNFVEDGMLDSFDIVDLVDQLETAFGVKIAGVDVLPENFASVDSIVSLVEKSKK